VVRRRRTPRLDAVSVLAVVIPLLTIGVLALVRQPSTPRLDAPPALTRLTAATVVCPAPAPGSPDAWVSTASGKSGRVSVIADGQTTPVQVRTGAVRRVAGAGAPVVKATGSLAPGLLGLRAGTAPLATQTCDVPVAEQWFTGLGAGAAHDSVIELVNPDAGQANADITLYGKHPFSARKLRGITIPAHRTVTLDLGAIAPRRVLLSAQVQVTRGRLGVHVLDSRTDLVTHRVRREWIPAQATPGTDNQLLGLPTGPGRRTLELANPGSDVVRAQVKIVTGDTSFAPAGLPPVSIPGGATISVPLTRVLAKALGDGAVGIEVGSDGPVTASVLTDTGADHAFTVADPAFSTQAATLLPVGSGRRATPVKATLYLSADSAGAATVTAYGVSGTRLLDKRVGQQQGHTATVPLPRGTAYLRVVASSTRLRGAVLVTGNGASVVPLHELLTQGLVPQIRPGLN
jgi:hypothetical protein